MGQNMVGVLGRWRAIVWLPHSSQDSSLSPLCSVTLFSIALVSFVLLQESAIGCLLLRVDLSQCIPRSLKRENNFRTQLAGGLWPLR